MSLKTLLTGASSRFGSYLIDELTRNGDSVIATGDFACGYPPNRERTKYLDTKMDSETILNLATDFDRIIHLPVSAGGPSQLLSSQAIVESTESLLRLASEKRSPFIFLSNSCVYGKTPGTESLSEESPLILGQPADPSWSYAIAHAMAEHFCLAFRDQYKMPVQILRIFNGYGPSISKPSIKDYGLVNRLIECAIRKEAMQLPGNGKQILSLTHFRDSARAIVSLSSRKDAPEVINIAGPEEISVNALADLIWRLAGNDGQPIIKYTKFEDRLQLYDEAYPNVADRKLFLSLCTTGSEVSIEEGINEILHGISTQQH